MLFFLHVLFPSFLSFLQLFVLQPMASAMVHYHTGKQSSRDEHGSAHEITRAQPFGSSVGRAELR